MAIPVKHVVRPRGRRTRPWRDAKALEERRRMRAADLFRRGVIPAEIARRLGVSHQIVSEWREAWRQGGRAALRAAGREGRPRKLTNAQLAKVERALARGGRMSTAAAAGPHAPAAPL
jgi:transposase